MERPNVYFVPTRDGRGNLVYQITQSDNKDLIDYIMYLEERVRL